MAVNKDKIDAARERLKEHKGGENLKMITDTATAREMQKRSVEARRRNKERLQSLSQFVSDLEKIGADVGDYAPKGIDALRFLMVQAFHDENFELAGQYAEKIAQYETPKLASQQVDISTRDITDLTDEELEEAMKALDEEEKDE